MPAATTLSASGGTAHRKIGAKISDKIWIQYKYFISLQSEFSDKIWIKYG